LKRIETDRTTLTDGFNSPFDLLVFGALGDLAKKAVRPTYFLSLSPRRLTSFLCIDLSEPLRSLGERAPSVSFVQCLSSSLSSTISSLLSDLSTSVFSPSRFPSHPNHRMRYSTRSYRREVSSATLRLRTIGHRERREEEHVQERRMSVPPRLLQRGGGIPAPRREDRESLSWEEDEQGVLCTSQVPSLSFRQRQED